MRRLLLAACLAAIASTASLAKDRRPGQADPEITWDKQAERTECGRIETTTDAQAAKGKHGQVASTEATVPCIGSGNDASASAYGKRARHEPGRE